MGFDPGWFALGIVVGYIAHAVASSQGVRQFRARSYRPPTPEERIDRAVKHVTPHWDNPTVTRGVNELKRFYRDGGQPIPSDKELKLEAEQLLNASVQGDTVV